jgi:adenylate cyclase
MNRITQKCLISVLIAGVSAGLALIGSRLTLIDRWEKQGQDLLYRNVNPEQHPDEVVIIAIDQNSLDYFQENSGILWPWPRDVYAITTDYLSHCGAKLIAYDIIFSSPDIDRLNVQAAYADAQFSEAMLRSGRVILATQMEDSTHNTLEPLVDQFSIEAQFPGPEQLVRRYPNLTLPIHQFQKWMAIPGVVNFFTDDDGICRRIPLLYSYQQRMFPYMALAAAMLYIGDSDIAYDQEKQAFDIGNHSIPVDQKGMFELYWYGAGGPGNTFTYISYSQLINSYLQWINGEKPQIPVETFKDKAVFIGATAAGLLDLKTTPFSSVEPYPGVEIYATLFSNIIQDDHISHFGDGLWLFTIFLILSLLCMSWQNFKVWQSSIVTLIMFIIPLICAVLLFQYRLTFFPAVRSEIALIVSIIGVLVVNYLAEGREKALVKKVFNRYLHPAVVDNLTRNSGKIEMGGMEIEATVLFTDLQDFTGISELFAPHEIVQFLNDYFERVETIIFKNNGMLDKYTGDGIMAIFGAPVESKEHALQTCRAVLDFQALSKMSVEKSSKNVSLITRVGVNSGNLIVGNIGSRNRMDYTAIGDTVNLSARLEGVNKLYGTQNIISESTYDFVKDDIMCREIDYIRVKGRDKPLKIFTVIAERNDVDNKTMELLSIHNEALEMYRRRKYRNAIESFSKVFSIQPDDSVAQVFVERCRQLLKNPELIDEKGIFNITVK